MFAGLSEYLSGVYSEHGGLNSSNQRLAKVELVTLLTDVSGLVRMRSQFTQFLNFSYRINKHFKPVLLEILSIDQPSGW